MNTTSILPTLGLDDVKTTYEGQAIAVSPNIDEFANGENNGQHQQHNISRG